MKQLFHEFFESEKAGGLILVVVTFLSLTLANTPLQESYIALWHLQPAGISFLHLINEGLMAIFFLLIGLELKREIVSGELSSLRRASLPVFSAIGGMLVPAVIFLVFNFNTAFRSGAGIPMATDIAFAIGILSLLGKRVPASLRIFLTALAVIDDLGAILVIAFFYTDTFSFADLYIAAGIFISLLLLNKLGFKSLLLFLAGGIMMWYFMLHSGIHASITGVLLAFAIPYGKPGQKSPSAQLQHFLHKPVAFIILPLFALANTCIPLGNYRPELVAEPISLGIIAGLVIGKPLGIWLFSYFAAGLGLCILPASLRWKDILGAGFLGGIGFTMSIFITLLAFSETAIINNAKIAVMIGSVVSGMIGFAWLKITLKDRSLPS